MRRAARAAVALAALPFLAGVRGVEAQERPREVRVSLSQAEEVARSESSVVAAAEARSAAWAERVRGSGAFRWPGLEASLGFARTDDPVGVFGTKLRQGTFGEADFAIESLNDPDAVSDWTAAVSTAWAVGDPVRWAESRAAEHSARAAAARAEHSTEVVVFLVRSAYLQAASARGQRLAVEAELRAAGETASLVARRQAEGMATEADGLQARSAVADAEARLAMAEAAYADAVAMLGVHLGWAADSVPVPLDGMPDLADRAAEETGWESRADLVAAEHDLDATRAEVAVASAARLPAAQLFASLGTHAPGLTDDRASNWSVGVQVRVPLFTGFGLEARRGGAEAEARAAEATHVDRLRRAEAEVRTARRGARAALESRDAALLARDASAEAARLLSLRYDEGMTTLSDLLGAQARAAGLAARLIEAEARWRMHLAQLDFLLGSTDPNSTEGNIR
jgi:outer membrane protein TolC